MRGFYQLIVAGLCLPLQAAFAQDVEATFSIRPSAGTSQCELTRKTVDAIKDSQTPDGIAALTGCPGRQVSKFELLGQTTVTYEFVDGRNRLQVTVQNNKVLSRTLRPI